MTTNHKEAYTGTSTLFLACAFVRLALDWESLSFVVFISRLAGESRACARDRTNAIVHHKSTHSGEAQFELASRQLQLRNASNATTTTETKTKHMKWKRMMMVKTPNVLPQWFVSVSHSFASDAKCRLLFPHLAHSSSVSVLLSFVLFTFSSLSLSSSMLLLLLLLLVVVVLFFRFGSRLLRSSPTMTRISRGLQNKKSVRHNQIVYGL